MMNSLFIIGILGKLMTVYALTMLIPLVFSLYTDDGAAVGFAVAAAVTLAVGFLGMLKGGMQNSSLRMREGYVVVLSVWLLAWFFGMLPFLFTGSVPSYVDAMFETISSLTTTGASVVSDWDEIAPSVILWRGIMHWLGGMGIVVLFVAVLPSLGVNAFNLFKTEAPGPVAERVVPRIRDTALTLWGIYAFFTLSEFILLFIAGMTPFDAVIHAISTTATCGFSYRSSSIAYYDNLAIELIIIFFMILSGGNFALYFHAWHRGIGRIFKDTEFRVYLSFIAAASFLVAMDLFLSGKMTAGSAINNALFQISSFITTTAFTTDNYDLWPQFSRKVLFFIMFIGACAGSTSGGIKISRYIILVKFSWSHLKKMLHPRVVTSVHIDNKPIDTTVLISVMQFFFLYMFTFAIAVLLISFTTDLQPFETLSLAAASLGNVGVGFGAVGPTGGYAVLPDSAKIISGICMLLGRLELTAVLVFLMPEFWRRQKGW